MEADKIKEIFEIQRLAPLVFWGASGFYASLLVLLIPAVRREFHRLFSPPVPITQSPIKSLDSLRGFAALGIACFHTWIWLQPFFDPVAQSIPLIKVAYKSVPIFVVLSGFLIYRSLRDFAELEDLRYYVRRRVLRIYPLYIASVLIFFALADVRPVPGSWFQRILPEIFMMKVFGYPTFIYPAYWSLYVEELFYLALPLWVVATRGVPLLSAYIGFAVFSLIGNHVPDDTAIIKYFFVGIILCELLDTKEIKKLKQLGAGAIFALGLFVLYLEHISGDVLGQYAAFIANRLGVTLVFDRAYNPADPYNHYYTATLGVGLGLAILGTIKFKPINRLLSLFPFRFLGTISYSLFIWNGFVILYGTNLYFNTMVPTVGFFGTAFPSFLSGGLVSFAGLYIPSFIFFASISYLVIERPFLMLRAGKKFRLKIPALASARSKTPLLKPECVRSP